MKRQQKPQHYNALPGCVHPTVMERGRHAEERCVYGTHTIKREQATRLYAYTAHWPGIDVFGAPPKR